MNWRDVPVPARMQGLPRDRRGYPIPDMIQRGANGEPLFTVNDTEKVWRHVADCLCGICGQTIEQGDFHFVGGSMSAFHPNGAYLDGPVHHECGQYALRVCPYIAMPGYVGGIPQEVIAKKLPGGMVSADQTMIPGKPICFVMIRTVSFNFAYPRTMHPRFIPVGDPFASPGSAGARMIDLEVWRNGEFVADEEEAMRLVRAGVQGEMQPVAEKDAKKG